MLPLVQQWIDRRLAVLGSDDDQGLIEEILFLQLRDKSGDGRVDELEFVEQRLAGSAGRVEISAGRVIARFDQLLADADRLEVHAEYVGSVLQLSFAEASVAIDPVEDRVDLQLVIALNVLKTVGPGRNVGAGIEDCGAGGTGREGHSRKPNHGGVDFRTVEVVQCCWPDTGGHRRVRWVLVGPRGDSTILVNDAEDAVDADELPRPDRRAAARRVAGQLAGINGSDGAVGQRRARSPAIDL